MARKGKKKNSKKRGAKKASKLGSGNNPLIGADLGGSGATEMASRGDKPFVGDWPYNGKNRSAKKGKKKATKAGKKYSALGSKKAKAKKAAKEC